MKILITEHDGPFKQVGWHIRDADTGFWAYLEPNSSVKFKFPWKSHTYKILEEK